MLVQAAPSSPASAPASASGHNSAAAPSDSSAPVAEISAEEAETIPASESALENRPGILVFPSDGSPTAGAGYHGLSAPDESGVLQAVKGPLPPIPTARAPDAPIPAHHQPPARLDSVQTVTTAADEPQEATEALVDRLADMSEPSKETALPLQRTDSSLVHCSSFSDASLPARVVKAQNRN